MTKLSNSYVDALLTRTYRQAMAAVGRAGKGPERMGFGPRSRPLDKRTVVQFFGGGQDSLALLYHYAYDAEFRRAYVGDAHFVVMMSDTGNEFPELYQNIPLIEAFCREHDIEFYFITREMGYHSAPWQSLQHQFYRNDNIMGVAFPKSCTDQLKIQVGYRFLTDWLGWAYGFSSVGYNRYYEYANYYGKLVSWIGFAADEESRVAGKPTEETTVPDDDENDEPLSEGMQLDLFGQAPEKPKRSPIPKYRLRCVEHRYPIIELGWNRARCQQIIAGYNKPVPPPTNCMWCPFQSEAEVVYLYRVYPQVWAEWVEREGAKYQKNAHKPVNMGVMGRLTLPEYLEKALIKYGDWSIEQLLDYRMSHGHCVKSKI